MEKINNENIGAIDVKLDELKIGRYKVKIIGVILKVEIEKVVLSVDKKIIELKNSRLSMDGLSPKLWGRFIVDLEVKENGYEGEIIAWNEFDKGLLDKYWKLIFLERRVPD